MNVLEEKKNSYFIARLEGKLDSMTAPAFEEKILKIIEQGEKFIAFDFSKVDYLSSAGLRSFLMLAKKLKAVSGKMTLFALSENIKEVFDITGFSSIIPICKTEAQALESFK